MRRKGALIVLLTSIFFLICGVVSELWGRYGTISVPIEYTSKIMGIPIVENRDFLEGKLRKETTENPGVYFKSVLLPYSYRNNTLYLSQSYEQDKWIGSLSAESGFYLCILQDDYLSHKEQAIKDGYPFTLWLVSEDSYYEFSLVVSGMPIIAISTERMEVQEKVPYEVDPDKLHFDSEDLYYGGIQVFDPGINGDDYEITKCNVRYHYKGATTSNFEKKGYAISLQNAKEENVDFPLLGMRSDNSWKLNAMVTDDNRIREMTACQIWEQLDAANEEVEEPGPRMEYVELVLDNDYQGLYCLVEPVDAKKLKLDADDVLYKVLHEIPFEDGKVQEAIDKGWRIMSPVRIRYPKVITDYAKVWHPMRDYTNKIYHGAEGYQKVAEMVYPENAYDMLIFLMVVGGSDNYYKNMYYAADVKSDGSYVMKQIPWDLDYTFGNVYDYNGKNFVRFESDITCEYREEAASLLEQYAPETYENILQDRWTRYRQWFLSTEAIQQLVLDNQKVLINSGVVARENARWPQYSMSTDIEYLLEYQSARMEWLDEYFGG